MNDEKESTELYEDQGAAEDHADDLFSLEPETIDGISVFTIPQSLATTSTNEMVEVVRGDAGESAETQLIDAESIVSTASSDKLTMDGVSVYSESSSSPGKARKMAYGATDVDSDGIESFAPVVGGDAQSDPSASQPSKPGAFFVHGIDTPSIDSMDNLAPPHDDSLDNLASPHDDTSSNNGDEEANEKGVDATLVQDDEEVQRRIEELKVDALNVTPEDENRRETWLSLRILCVFGLFLVVVGVTLMATHPHLSGNTDKMDSSVPPPMEAPMMNKNLTKWEIAIELLSPLSGRNTLLDPLTPQHQALSWLVYNDTRDIWDDATSNPDHLIERFVLAVFYFATGGDTWSTYMSFLMAYSVCHWRAYGYGIFCNDKGYVTDVQLAHGTNLNGTLPIELSALVELEQFAITGHGLHGTLPSSFGKLTKLRRLQIYDTQLSGSLPTSLSNLRRLQALSITINRLTGRIPHDLFKELHSLEYLDLGFNQLTGPIPGNLSRLDDLRNFELDFNLLNGTIPEALFSASIEKIDIGNNQLSGTLPSHIGLLPKASFFRVGVNNLSGSLPAEIGMMTDIEFLDVGQNSLTGNIPSELGLLTRLKQIYLHHNYFSGTIPPELSSLDPEYIFLLSTDVIGNMDMFCDKTSLSTKIFAECRGNDSKIDCSCCATCCDASLNTSMCLANHENICRIETTSYELDIGTNFQDGAGTSCSCISGDNDTTLSCQDSTCLLCNKDRSMCATQSINITGQFGITDSYKTTFQYVVGSNSTLTFENRFDGIFACEVAVNGKPCFACNFVICNSGFVGYNVNCENLDGVGLINICDEQIPEYDDGVLAVLAAQDTRYRGTECGPRLLPDF